MGQVYKRAKAKDDLVGHFVYLAGEAGLEVAERFLLQSEMSFTALSQHPKMGTSLRLRRRELKEMRKWAIEGFENFLIFYLPHQKGVSIVRVLHGSQDWWNRLDLL